MLLMRFIILIVHTRYCVTIPVALGFAIVACGIGAAAFTLETYLLYYTHSNETGNSSMFRRNGKPFSTFSLMMIYEKGYDTKTDNLIVAIDPKYFRPTEVEALLGDPTKAKERFGWTPKITFEEMVYEMMKSDINIAKRDSLVKGCGFKAPDFNE